MKLNVLNKIHLFIYVHFSYNCLSAHTYGKNGACCCIYKKKIIFSCETGRIDIQTYGCVCVGWLSGFYKQFVHQGKAIKGADGAVYSLPIRSNTDDLREKEHVILI